ncbi:hypothetical protein ABZS76_32880 [Streptomyces sp. NPDC005562]|uniref:hypothetical protein n=1 Tax=Streptomyces sp. NPDC005562 TaxID=3154890 RepID=UPI0033B15450
MAEQPTRITVDLVTPTKGLVTVLGRDVTGTALNDARRGEAPGSGWSVEDADGQRVATGKRGAANAAKALARAAGITGPITVDIDEEYKRTGERDSDEIRAAAREAHAAPRTAPLVTKNSPATAKAPAPAAAPKPGGKPSVTAVIKFLKEAGFAHSRYTDSKSAPTAFGFYVRDHGLKGVSVMHREGDHTFFERMARLGLTDVAQVPDDPNADAIAAEYADALTPRYHVENTGGGHLYLTAREWLPARPHGVPTATQVRAALKNAGVSARPDHGAFRVVDQPDHTRVAVLDGERLDAVVKTLTAEGWTFEQFETSHHHGIKITGAAADRRERLAALKARREQQAPAHAPEGDVPIPAQDFTPEQVSSARQLLAEREEPQEPTEAPKSPQPGLRGARRAFYTRGTRVTYRTTDGFWMHGTVKEAHPQNGSVLIAFDTRQVAPANRPNYPGHTPTPGRPHTISPADKRKLNADDKRLTLSKEQR